MPKYTVYATQKQDFEAIIEADNENEANQKALSLKDEDWEATDFQFTIDYLDVIE